MSGQPVAFGAAAFLVMVWLVTGPIFGFSDTWQLVMNTVSSIVTFLMVFVIQNTQNRQTDALQLKLDELIRATRGAQNQMLDLEDADDDATIDKLRDRYASIAREAREAPRPQHPRTEHGKRAPAREAEPGTRPGKRADARRGTR